MPIVRWITSRTSNMNEESLVDFFYFLRCRHNIYFKKESGCLKPWTEDPILRDYKFCNVFRELDTTTIWIRENIRHRWRNHKYLWFALAVARRINLPVTLSRLDDLLVNWNPENAFYDLEHRRRMGLPIYGGAYSLSTSSIKMSKNEYTVYECLDKLWQRREGITEFLESDSYSIEEVFRIFRIGNPGISGFLAYEIVTDMRHTRYLDQASDIMTWANAGPGAIRGLNRIKSNPIDSRIKPCQANKDMQYLLSQSAHYLPNHFPTLEMRDIEHSLCEFDKYMRIKFNKSYLCRRYDGKGE
jgi:hypothetical protein